MDLTINLPNKKLLGTPLSPKKSLLIFAKLIETILIIN